MGKKKDDIPCYSIKQAFDEKEREWIAGDLGLAKEDAAQVINILK